MPEPEGRADPLYFFSGACEGRPFSTCPKCHRTPTFQKDCPLNDNISSTEPAGNQVDLNSVANKFAAALSLDDSGSDRPKRKVESQSGGGPLRKVRFSVSARIQEACDKHLSEVATETWFQRSRGSLKIFVDLPESSEGDCVRTLIGTQAFGHLPVFSMNTGSSGGIRSGCNAIYSDPKEDLEHFLENDMQE